MVSLFEKCSFEVENFIEKCNYHDGKVIYMPICLVMFLESNVPAEDESEPRIVVA